MKKITALILIFLWSAFSLSLEACSGKEVAKAPEKKAAAPTKEVTGKEVKTPEAISEPVVIRYEFSSQGKRDPFMPFVTDIENSEDLPPLQRYDIYQFKVNGILAGTKRDSKAMVTAPDGQVYIVEVGTKIGRHQGEIVDINARDGIVIKEEFMDFYHRKQSRKSNLSFIEEESK